MASSDLKWLLVPTCQPLLRAALVLPSNPYHTISLPYNVDMSDSSSSSSGRQSRAPSVSSLTSVEESSPLLRTLSKDSFKSYGSGNAVRGMADSKQLSTSQLLWVMSSVWIGTLLAGLGEQHQ
ncbi:hypothetical protein N7G274_010074 [Stereocaulon virgatum]|uniref:Uncharacterized protein n=1 Tax=Stereocaulon virgatum TaxID=373712 RepID=A0ABR3ZWB1_9LECA